MSKITTGSIIFTLGITFLSVGMTSFVLGFTSSESMEIFRCANNVTALDKEIQEDIEFKEWRAGALRILGMGSTLAGLVTIKFGMDTMNSAWPFLEPEGRCIVESKPIVETIMTKEQIENCRISRSLYSANKGISIC